MSLGIDRELNLYEERAAALKRKLDKGELTQYEYLQAKENIADELMMSIDKEYLMEKDYSNFIRNQKNQKEHQKQMRDKHLKV